MTVRYVVMLSGGAAEVETSHKACNVFFGSFDKKLVFIAQDDRAVKKKTHLILHQVRV